MKLFYMALLFILLASLLVFGYYFPPINLLSQVSNWINSTSWSTFIIIVLLIVNLLLLIVLKTIISWRRTISMGMEAVVPTELINTFKDWKSSISKKESDYKKTINQIESILNDLFKSLNIFKNELDLKDGELKRLKGISEFTEKEKILYKLISLHSKFSKLEHQVKNNVTSPEVAISFLKDDISEIFQELGLELINPSVGDSVKSIFSNGYTIQGEIKVSDPALNLTVSELLIPGYIYRSLGGEIKVLKSALITINRTEV